MAPGSCPASRHTSGVQASGPAPAETTPPEGLSADAVADRVARGQTNAADDRSSRTVGEILRGNLLTRFNFILSALLVVILIFGQLQDALFGIVLVTNALIGIAQELRAKRTLDRLTVLTAPHVHVVRGGEVREVSTAEVVLGDLVELRAGDQVVSDGVVRSSAGLEVDESLLTGEADAVAKNAGDTVLSGSFAVSGSARYQATGVGAGAYARQLVIEARRFSLMQSELIGGINRILRYVTWAIPPVAVLLLVSQLHGHEGVRDAVSGTVAALVGMVPQGLVLLTSIAFAVAALTLARRSVVVQELPAVEGLARVDVICFDKTGTLTDGVVRFERVVPVDRQAPVDAALGALAADENRNATLTALAAAYPSGGDWVRTAAVPFSSQRKWSAATFADRGTWVLGAPEMVLSDTEHVELERARQMAASGRRVVILARSAAELHSEQLPADVQPVAHIVFMEHVRGDAADTVAYFAQQGVAMKVMSGDSPHTVAAVAQQAGVPGADHAVDARELPAEASALAAALSEHALFGRVSPHQKQEMVRALQAQGHTVAMTGDGVNDALALKLADVGVAMGSGAAATKAVAQLVLLDGSFATMPRVVAEGRRVTANIERVASTFITKTVWATVLALIAGASLLPYPFLPRHLTIVDTLTIGVPSFFLALAPNLRRYEPGFVNRVLRFTVPCGMVVAAFTFAAFMLARAHGLTLTQQRTSATLVALALSLAVLLLLAWPLTWRRALLLAAVALGFVLLFPVASVRRFYALELPAGVLGLVLLIAAGGAAVLLLVGSWLRGARRAT